MLKIEIRTGGAAYCDPCTGEESNVMEESQVAHDLRRIAHKIMNGQRSGKLMDVNGNNVGFWSLDQKGG